MTSLTLGILSDTHIPHRLKRLPEAVLDALAGVDLILHAGDVDDPRALEPLRAIAPVHAVRGNVHVQDLSDGGSSLPAEVEVRIDGQRIVLTHGHEPGLVGFLRKSVDLTAWWLGLVSNNQFNRRIARRLAQRYPQADIIVFGHTHVAHVEQVRCKLFINPGAVCAGKGEHPSVARVQLGDGAGKPEIEIIPLRASFDKTPEEVWP